MAVEVVYIGSLVSADVTPPGTGLGVTALVEEVEGRVGEGNPAVLAGLTEDGLEVDRVGGGRCQALLTRGRRVRVARLWRATWTLCALHHLVVSSLQQQASTH